MGRGLDGYFDIRSLALCSFEGPRRVVSARPPVAIARGKHLFPFRTEPLSPSAPMVLGPQGPGRVGRRRFCVKEPHGPRTVRLSRVLGKVTWQLEREAVPGADSRFGTPRVEDGVWLRAGATRGVPKW